MDFSARRKKLFAELSEQGLSAICAVTPRGLRYFSGFTGGEGWLFMSPELTCLVTDGRYWAQVAEQCPDIELVKFVSKEDVRHSKKLAARLKELGFAGKIGFEGSDLSYAKWKTAEADLAEVSAVMADFGSLIDGQRVKKDSDEIEAIRKSAHAADVAWKNTVPCLKAGMTEADFCAELEYQMQKAGARKPSFDTIVASGPNGCFPHAGVTNRAIGEGELITVDFGTIVDGYCSDITRTVWLGELDKESLKIWETVRRAHDAALEAVRPGLKGTELDKIARDIIAQAGYGEYFSHSLGHGVGIEVHEEPGLRPESQTVIEAGMFVTIEPGIYIPGKGGCRIEDLVCVTKDGYDVMSRSPYQVPGQKHPQEAF